MRLRKILRARKLVVFSPSKQLRNIAPEKCKETTTPYMGLARYAGTTQYSTLMRGN
jgi:hypothetical protein